jgi:hypothetical protein
MYKSYFLQSISEFEIKTSPLDIAGFVIVFCLLTALIIFMNTSERIKKNAVLNGKGIDIKLKERVHVDANFFSKVKYLGLNKHEASVLEKTLNIDGENPSAVLLDAAKVNECFKYACNKILRDKNPNDDAQQQLLELFSIRNAVEYGYAVKKKQTDKTIARSYSRKSLASPCTIYKVIMKTTSGKPGGKKTLDIQKDAVYSGTVVNVSQGGCAVSAANNIRIGSLIKTDFKISSEPVTALCQILRSNKDGSNWVYHVKFLKLSKKSLLTLNMFIFDCM